MLNYVAFILIVLFIPAVTFLGVRMHKPQIKTVTKILTWIFFGCELLRFFYNASLYRADSAIQPSDELTLTYLSIMCALAMFARFNKGVLGNTFRYIFVFSALTPFILGLFDPSIYTNPVDTHAVVTALYFVETGFVFALTMLYLLDNSLERIQVKQLVFVSGFMALYVGLNALARFFFTDLAFGIIWILSMVTIVISACAIAFMFFMFGKKRAAMQFKN